jgi:hypothetical protein
MHVALDRILWKGDYSERVMVTGKDLKAILKTAQEQVMAQESLAARDTVDQWLVTFGVTTSDKKDLTRLEASGHRFGVPRSEECRGDKSVKTPRYCVNGSAISDDAGYWVATSDHIANDPAVYSVLNGEPAGYHKLELVKLTKGAQPQGGGGVSDRRADEGVYQAGRYEGRTGGAYDGSNVGEGDDAAGTLGGPVAGVS